MSAVVRTLVTAIALWVAIRLLPGLTFDGSTLALVGIALVVGVVNGLIRPIMRLVALPLVLATLGLFLLVVNAASLAIALGVSRALDLGLESAGFGWTFLAAIVVSLVSWALNLFVER